MADRHIAVIDAGSSRARCFVLDQNADVVSSRSAEWRYARVEDASPYATEFDPDWLWRTICGLLSSALADSRVPPRSVAAVTPTSQRQAVVFLDRGGRELYAGPNLDLRAVFEGGAIDEEMRDRVYATTGHTPSFFFAPAKMRWFQSHRPEVFDRVASVVTLADWLVWKLSGQLAGERSLAGEAGLLDLPGRHWCGDLLADLGLPDNDHVPLVEPGTLAGTVTADAAGATGLPEGTPVAVASPDTQCGLLGMGVAAADEVGVVAGWSAPVMMATDRPVLPEAMQTWAGCHVVPGLWTLESTSGDAGNAYRWLGDTLWGGGEDAYKTMDAEAARVPVGSDGATAFLGPSPMDMGRVGMRQGGLLFPVPLTFSDLGRGHLARSALEALAFSTRANLERLERVTGATARSIAVGGGMVKTATWVRVLADVVGREIAVSPSPHVSALGAYVCAATALGEFESVSQGGAAMAERLNTVEPDAEARLEYQDHYERWRELLAAVEDLGV